MFELPKIAYAYDALEPHLDARTMEIHHTKHHQAYVDNLNKAVSATPELQGKSLEELLRGIASAPESVRNVVKNHGGGHHNHSLFWEVMGPGGGGEASGALGDEIKAAFGGHAALVEKLSAAAVGQFGSGWGWLVVADGKLEIFARPNQDSPLMEGKTPILGVDVWEHAYYLHYQNRRADYVKAWWNAVRWDKVAERRAAARG